MCNRAHCNLSQLIRNKSGHGIVALEWHDGTIVTSWYLVAVLEWFSGIVVKALKWCHGTLIRLLRWSHSSVISVLKWYLSHRWPRFSCPWGPHDSLLGSEMHLLIMASVLLKVSHRFVIYLLTARGFIMTTVVWFVRCITQASFFVWNDS